MRPKNTHDEELRKLRKKIRFERTQKMRSNLKWKLLKESKKERKKEIRNNSYKILLRQEEKYWDNDSRMSLEQTRTKYLR
jgi:hypothetical protein